MMMPDGAGSLFPDTPLLLALLSVVGVGLLVGLEVWLIKTREAKSRRAADLLKEERAALETAADELESFQGEIDSINDKIAKLSVEKLRIGRQRRRQATYSRLFVHEIGGREQGRRQFVFPLKPVAALLRSQPEKAIFHPDIWQYRNEVHVWATDLGVAQMLVRSVFNGATGAVIDDSSDDASEDASEDSASDSSEPAGEGVGA